MKSLKCLLPLAAASLLATDAHAYRVLVDLNTFKASFGLGNVPNLKCDGVWSIPANSDLTTAQWQTLYSQIGGWNVSEDNPPDSGAENTNDNTEYTRVLNYAGSVSDAFCYNETGSQPNTCFTPAQLNQYAAAHGNHIVTLTRSYTAAYQNEVNVALSNANCSGIALEMGYQYDVLGSNIPALVNQVVNVSHKRFYLLFAHSGSAHIAAQVNALQVSSASAAAMQSSSVFVVPAYYGGMTAANCFGDNDTIQGNVQVAYEMNAVGNGPNGPTNGVYTMTNYHSGMLMEVAGASTANLAKVDQNPSNSASNQQWYVNYLGNSRYTCVNVGSTRALTIQSASTAQGQANVIQYSCDYHKSNTDQLFTLAKQGDGSFNINAVCSGLSLEPIGASQSGGINIGQYPTSTGSFQNWVFTKQ